jgi:hypothetical protein
MRKGRRDPPGFMVLMIGDESQKASDAWQGLDMPEAGEPKAQSAKPAL